MAILVPRWLDFSWQVRLQMCLKFCMVKVANCTDQPTSRRTEFFKTATRFGPSTKLLYRFLRHLFPGVTLEPGV